PLAALSRDGVEYVEVRCLDLNPYLPVGVEADQIRFLNWYLFWCLTADSPPISDVECERVGFNQRLTVLYGRDPELRLVGADSVCTLRDWGHRIIDQMEALVRAVAPNDQEAVLAAMKRYRGTLDHPERTPSGRLSADMLAQGKGFRELVLELAQAHREVLAERPLSEAKIEQFRAMSEQSWTAQSALEHSSLGTFEA
ncbi:MAG: glutamate--cysteine ligase, partial [Natronospirillum sp.]